LVTNGKSMKMENLIYPFLCGRIIQCENWRWENFWPG
jgi:hypothetical protein